METLKRAIELAGGQGALAAKVNALLQGGERIGSTAIANWIQRGQVPADRVIPVARAVDHQVTPHDLRPDLYPHPSDGLPEELKERAA